MTFTYKHTKYAAYIGYITQAIVNNLMPLLFVSFQRDFGISFDKISLLIVMNFGVQIVTDIVAAKFADRVGYRKLTVFAHVFAVCGLVMLSFLPFVVNPFLGLCVCSGIMAVGGGLTDVVISPIVEALPGDEKVSAMGLLHSFYCWGQVGVVLFSTAFFTLAGVENWRILPILWAVVPLFNAFFFSKVPLRTLNEDGESVGLRKLFSVKIMWVLILLMLCAGASELAMSQWASYFAEEGLGVSKTFGDLLGPCAFAVLMGTARTIYGFWGEKINLKKSIGISGGLCVMSYLIVVFAENPIVSLLGCAVCGLSVGIMWPGTFSLASMNYPQGGTAMFAILALAGDVGCSCGPSVVGFVSGITGQIKSGILGAIVFPIGLILGLIFLKSKKTDS